MEKQNIPQADFPYYKVRFLPLSLHIHSYPALIISSDAMITHPKLENSSYVLEENLEVAESFVESIGIKG